MHSHSIIANARWSCLLVLCGAFALGGTAAAQRPAPKPSSKAARTHANVSAQRRAGAARAHDKPAAPDPLDLHVSAARTYQVAADYDAAAAEYRKAIAIGLQRMAKISVADGKYSDGIGLLRDAAGIDRSNSEIAEDLAVADLYAGKLDDAQTQLDGVLKRQPEDVRALSLLGRVYFLQGKYEPAAGELHESFLVRDDVDVLYVNALAHLAAGKIENATVLFDDIRATVPDTPELHMLLGRAFQATGHLDKADTEFKRALQLNFRLVQANLQLGIDDLLRKDPEKYSSARDHFQAESAVNPKDYSSHYLTGVMEFGQNQFAAAEASLAEAAQLDASNPDPWFFLGQIYMRERRADQAINALTKSIALTSDPTRNDGQLARAHYILGQILEQHGEREKGTVEIAESQQLRAKYPGRKQTGMGTPGVLEQLSEQMADAVQQQLRAVVLPKVAVVVDDKDKPAYLAHVASLLGNSYHNLGVIDARASRYAEASTEFAGAARWVPDIPGVDHDWGLAAFRAQKYADAVVPLQRELKRTPNDTQLREMLGISYYMMDDYAHSADVFRPVLDKLSANPGLLYAAGTALVRSGDTANAKILFTRMLQHDSNVPEVHLMLGQAQAGEGDYAAATAEFSRALELNPRLPEAHFNLGMVDFRQGKADDAADQFRAELSLNPSSVPAQYQLAYVLLQQHKADDAIALLRKVLVEQPDYADAHYELGKALLDISDVPAATQQLETAVQLQPTDYAYYQLSIAYRRSGREADAQKALEMYTKLKPKPPNRENGTPQ